ncbi:MAG: radical SAM protein [Syntrophobacter sp.]
MNRLQGKSPAPYLKRLKVLGRHFVYNTRSMLHAELDARTSASLGRIISSGEGPASLQLPAGIASVLEPAPGHHHPGAAPEFKSIILQIAHACNLRCRYCSADFGRYGSGSFRMMSPETARRGIDFLFDNSPSPQLAINYFGGEPLLNLPTVLESARYALVRAEAEGREVSPHLVTNGVLLTPGTILRLDDLGFSLTVSLDGPPAHHDSARPAVDGASSFAPTARALQMMANLPIGQRVTVRGTFTRDSAYFFPFAKFILEAGFSNNLAYEPVFLPFRDPLSIRWRDVPSVRKAYEDLAGFYVAKWKEREPFCLWDFDDAVTQLALGLPRQSRCGAGASTVALTAEGDIYACHMSTGMQDALLGNLAAGFAEKQSEPWLQRYIEGRAGCSGCWLDKLCGGGCNTHALLYNKSLSRPYRLECELIEHRYRLAFWILSEVSGLREAIRASHTALNRPSDSGHHTIPLWNCVDLE